MRTVSELEILKRSAAMAPLPRNDVHEVLEQCIQLERERQQIAVIVAELPSTWIALREALNALHRILRP